MLRATITSQIEPVEGMYLLSSIQPLRSLIEATAQHCASRKRHGNVSLITFFSYLSVQVFDMINHTVTLPLLRRIKRLVARVIFRNITEHTTKKISFNKFSLSEKPLRLFNVLLNPLPELHNATVVAVIYFYKLLIIIVINWTFRMLFMAVFVGFCVPSGR